MCINLYLDWTFRLILPYVYFYIPPGECLFSEFFPLFCSNKESPPAENRKRHTAHGITCASTPSPVPGGMEVYPISGSEECPQLWTEGHLISGMGGSLISVLSRGTPISGMGYPHFVLTWGVLPPPSGLDGSTPCQAWLGVPAH